MNVIIIEDEYLMADDLEEVITSCDPSIKVIAKLASVREAVDFFSNNPLPDLFFSDIQLPDGLSFEIFESIRSNVPVIFCTAYNEYALEAFKANGIDYILKPFNNESINTTLKKYNDLTSKQSSISSELKNMFADYANHQPKESAALLIQQADKIFPIAISDIALVYLDTGISYVYTFSQKKYATDYSMDTIEKKLGRQFYRANRQVIVSRKVVHHASRYFARKLLVTPKIPFPEQIIVSKANASNFLRWLESD